MEVIYYKTVVELMQENFEIAHNLGKRIEKFILDKEEFQEFLRSDYYEKEYWVGNVHPNNIKFLEIPVVRK